MKKISLGGFHNSTLTTQRVCEDLNLAKKDSKKAEQPPADAGKDAETQKKDADSKGKGAEPELPWGEETDRYKVAKALIAGETDKGKMMKELGVSINAIYNVTTDLTGMGVPLAIHQKKKVSL
ncbi:hypothetical protein MUP77_04255, partial [Candidatus Bathyarchaeota archaeon]|nr:hypothetical protein [Candidatus Bathyarchaeota archaeon]